MSTRLTGTATGAVPREGGAVDASRDFADWVSPHLPAMSRLAARLAPGAAEDVVQDALERAWRRRSTYDVARGHPGPWLLAIVADRARRHRTRLRLVEPLRDRPVDDPARDLDLERAVTRLSGRQRLAVELYYFVGLDTAGCADAMDCSEGTVRATLHHARGRLRALLEGEA